MPIVDGGAILPTDIPFDTHERILSFLEVKHLKNGKIKKLKRKNA